MGVVSKEQEIILTELVKAEVKRNPMFAEKEKEIGLLKAIKTDVADWVLESDIEACASGMGVNLSDVEKQKVIDIMLKEDYGERNEFILNTIRDVKEMNNKEA